jgi:hypothetical protein
MFTLLRFLVSLVIFAIVVWFVTMVPLGKLTLWQHLRAISSTQEVKDLTDGTKQEARKVADRILQKDAGAPDLAPTRPLDDLDARDRRSLDQLARKKHKHSN